jgi:hypothetical protein
VFAAGHPTANGHGSANSPAGCGAAEKDLGATSNGISVWEGVTTDAGALPGVRPPPPVARLPSFGQQSEGSAFQAFQLPATMDHML